MPVSNNTVKPVIEAAIEAVEKVGINFNWGLFVEALEKRLQLELLPQVVSAELREIGVEDFLRGMTSLREEVNSGTPNEWGEAVREEAERAAKLCDKLGIVYHKEDEYNEETGMYRQVFSDGTKGEWE